MSDLTIADVRAAAHRIATLVPATPILRSDGIDRWVGTRVHLKAEHLHATGAFKLRGATNAVLQLSDEQAARGVVAHSSGNHASALARAAAARGIACTIVIPRGAPAAKVATTREAGGRIVECEPTMEARAAAVARLVAETSAVEVHPFDDPRVQAGQGTATLELLDAVPQIGMVVAPVSGGGLLSGTAVAAHGIDPAILVWGAEPHAVDDAARSLAAGRLVLDGAGSTIADGLVAQLSEGTFAILRREGVQVVTVSEDEIVEAMRRLAVHAKQIVEPSGAVALAGLVRLVREGTELPGDVGVIVSGGNVDLDRWHDLVGRPAFRTAPGTP
ncbi:MAG: threonine/serine dehydratase [Acidimicrobiales bacterium]